MELESMRMVATAAADLVIGVNAMIDALPIDVGDVRPPHVNVYNAADHPAVARQAIGDGDLANIQLPAIAIFCKPTHIDQVTTSVRDGEVPIVIAYIDKKADSAEVQRNGLYANRAVLRFLRRFADPAYVALRTRNGIHLLNPTVDGTQQGQVNQKWGSAWAITATNITWRARETAA